jgi:hypothetical protein
MGMRTRVKQGKTRICLKVGMGRERADSWVVGGIRLGREKQEKGGEG